MKLSRQLLIDDPFRSGSPAHAASTSVSLAYVQIHDAVVGQIATGALQVGDRLASESDLAGQFGVGRPTVRQALAMLRNNGWIVSRRGSGSFVQRATPRPTMMGFDGLTRSLAAKGHQLVDEVLDRRVVTTPPTEVILLPASVAGATWWQVTRLRRVRSAGVLAPFCVEVDAFPLERIPDAAERFATSGSATDVLADTVLSQCEVAMQAVVATPDDARLLGVPAGSPLLAMERVNRANDGAAVHVGVFRFNTAVMPLEELQVNPSSLP